MHLIVTQGIRKYITHVVKEIINDNTNYETLVPWAIKLA